MIEENINEWKDYETFEAAEEAFLGWGLGAVAALKKAQEESKLPFSKDSNGPALEDMVGRHSKFVGDLADLVATAKDFEDQMRGIVSATVDKELGWNIQKNIVEQKIHKAVRLHFAIERTATALKKRMDKIATLLVTRRDEYRTFK